MYDSMTELAVVCPHCGTTFDRSPNASSPSTCSDCGPPFKHDVTDSWVNVARVANLAEAGFLNDELIGAGIDARIHQLEEFNAVYDRWSAAYLIQVPEEAAEE